MAEEEDPWGFDESTDTKAEEQPAAAAAAAPAADAQPSGEQAAAPAEGEAPPPPPAEDDTYRKPVQLYKHWVRPKYLQYKYIYNYRTNYYDDVIDYLDKKQRGVKREIPRPQTWAERVLRSNAGNRYDWYFDVPLDLAVYSRNWGSQNNQYLDQLSQVLPRSLDSSKLRRHEDHHLIQVLAASIKAHNYHTKSYINRKYSSVL